jgi:hypothetical protein
MSDTDIEKLLSKGENESPLTVIDDVPIESEDVHICLSCCQTNTIRSYS